MKALLIDSWYDSYLGVVVMVRIIDGTLKRGDKIMMMQSGAKYTVDQVGVLTPNVENVTVLRFYIFPFFARLPDKLWASLS